jgi:hypothetical protein
MAGGLYLRAFLVIRVVIVFHLIRYLVRYLIRYLIRYVSWLQCKVFLASWKEKNPDFLIFFLATS